MNHDNELRILGLSLKLVLARIDADISKIQDPKHQVMMKQQFEKAQHWMIKMTEALDDLNEWLTAFGPEVE